MKDLMTRFWSDDSGQGLTEYALIIGLVSIGLILVLTAFRGAIADVFRGISSQLSSVPTNQESP